MAQRPTSAGSSDGRKIIAENRRARHDYHILETYEAGIALVGTEVKSLRNGSCTIADAYIRIEHGNALITGMHIPVYDMGNRFNHDPLRDRRLLLHRSEIDKIEAQVTRKGCTAVPLSLYFTRGRAKLAIGIAKGKDRGDKRQAIAERDTKRQVERDLKMRIR